MKGLKIKYILVWVISFWALLALPGFRLIAQDSVADQPKQEIIPIDSRMEMFVDPLMIDQLIGTERRLHHPYREEPALYFDQPWEGKFCGYATVFKEDSLYRMYYRGLPEAGKDGSAGEVTCYAESIDGINWRKPSLGIYEVMGTTDNNVVLAGMPPFSHNFSPFLDSRPGVRPDQQYKALAGTEKSGLVAFVSADGFHWKKLQEKPVLTDGMFDSQNVAFWSDHENLYVCYFRTWTGEGYAGFRSISRATSPDFIHWSETQSMTFGDTPPEHLYTSGTTPYFRAPHIYLALPNRFFPRKAAFREEEAKQLVDHPGYRVASSDAVLMSSRGGNQFDRSFMEGFIPPGPEDRDWVSRNNMPAWGIVPGNEREIFLYRLGHYAQASSHLIRYTLRKDGFISVYAPYQGGEMITRPLTFAGKQLHINFATSAAGFVKVEIQDLAGHPIEGFTLEDAHEIAGDRTDQKMSWNQDPDVGSLAGKPVRLRFVMKDADLFSFWFE